MDPNIDVCRMPTLQQTFTGYLTVNCVPNCTELYLIIGKLEQGIHGVPSRGEDEDQGSTGVGVLEGLGKVERWWLDVLAVKLGRDKVLYRRHHLRECGGGGGGGGGGGE